MLFYTSGISTDIMTAFWVRLQKCKHSVKIIGDHTEEKGTTAPKLLKSIYSIMMVD